MNLRGRILVLVLASAAAAPVFAQGFPSGFPEEEVLVIVWKGGERCSVLDRKTNCSRVANVMSGPLQVGRERNIVVAMETDDEPTRIRASQVMSDIKAAGFRRVRPAGVAGAHR